ncbi:MAG TPA: alpha-ketoglutarate-dependent dioxygenase AlkB [Acidimicrobiia bacterium]|nr:alpha-ketoglutarate-dependent dioxygenase AlkB [Acidimicrobiia bacterium]
MTVYQTSLLGAGDPAVDPTVPFERMQLDDRSWVDVARGWLRGADTLLDALIERVDWQQHRRWMYERMVDDPRLSRWYTTDEPLPHPALEPVRSALETHYDVPLGGLGLNYYRDGRDSVAPHRDRELRHLDDTLIAIVTLGARRPFPIRPRGGGKSRDISPASGDLLVMGGRTQVNWEHGVPKVKRAGPRISATWRWSSQKGAVDRT